MIKFIKGIFTTVNGDPNRNAIMGLVLVVFGMVYAFITKDSVISLGAIGSGAAMFIGSIKEDGVGPSK